MPNSPFTRVLLVEDSPTQAILTLAVLDEAAGVSATHVETLADAVAAQNADPCDVALLDLTLPDSAGIHTVLRLCGHFPELPVVVLTNQDDDEQALLALSMGAQDYLVKGRLEPGWLLRAFRYAMKRKGSELDLIRARDELTRRIAELEDTQARLEAQSADVIDMAEGLALARDEALRANRELAKRIREVDCLYNVSRALDSPERPLDDILAEVVRVVPTAWQFPDLAVARVTHPDGTMESEHFVEGPWGLEADIVGCGRSRGRVEVFYRPGLPDPDRDPFLDSERRLIDELARRLGQAMERRQARDELQRLATTDPLTGTANRRHFMQNFEAEVARAGRYQRSLSAIMMDIDHFKRVNDTHGHATGDRVLKAFAVACHQSLRAQDRLGRLGGEEFAAVLPETDRDGALIVAERIRQAVAALQVPVESGTLRITVSLGVVQCGPDEGVDACLHRADGALYRAKQGGRNRVEMA